ncbi:MAG: putative DnaK suppressor protein [uncultured Blastococcus sp.]|uniref:Putative DnaK suppressor protein n=1 Tax=uncultured Blastococcus sp. TaxID=217144 RepID=A0A6J4IZ01_9ACTN|nr:MAG: putative DnaK suppressor protein [uncultured Blastococcus sp.]
MSTSLDSSTASTGSSDRFRALLDEQRADCVRQREEALAECAQSVPDPVAQRRSADLQVTLGEIDAALARIDAGTYGRCTGCQAEIPGERLELRPFARTCVSCSAAA